MAPPTGVLTVPATGTVNVPVTFGFVGSDPEGLPIAYDVYVSYQGGSSGACCYTGTSFSRTFGSPGVYRISVQAIDRQLNVSPVYTGLIAIDGATGVPPIASAVLSAESGPAPLSVTVDLRGSTDPDGTISTYYFDCATGWGAGNSTGTSTCTFTTPGTYWILLHVSDNAGLMGVTWKTVVVTPPGATPPPPPDTTAPSVSITNPTAGASVSGTVTLRASAADELAGSGVKEVQYYLDAVSAGSSLGISTTSPYSVSWNANAATYGSHTIYAVARDNAGNASTAASVSVTRADGTAPTVRITNPTAGASVSGAVTLTATAADESGGSGVKEVEFFLDGLSAGASLGTVATSPYSMAWNASSLGSGPHTIYAVARDNAGNASPATSISVTRPDTVAPSLAITSPGVGASISGTVTLASSASDDAGGSGVKEVQYYLDGVSIGIATGAPSYALSWNASAATYGSHTITAVARDNAGNASDVASVTVFRPDVTAPTVRITAPAAGTNVTTGSATLTASPADETGGSGVKEVQYYLDTISAGTSLGVVASGPTYALTWNTSGVTPGAHTIYAVARDYAGNASLAATLSVNVALVVPATTLSGPTTVARKGTASFSAAITNMPTYAVARVDFLVGTTVVCSDTTASYTCSWKAPASRTTVTVVARAYDANGNMASSNSITLKVG
ncbi:MAG: Ig-like domain-containing protein [Actinomycetota bacterium]